MEKPKHIGECNEWQNDEINEIIHHVKIAINGRHKVAIFGALQDVLAEIIFNVALNDDEIQQSMESIIWTIERYKRGEMHE